MIKRGRKSPRGGAKSLITIPLALTVLFPEIGVVPFSDVQPNFFIISFLLIPFLANKLRVSMNFILYAMLCMICLWLSFVVHQKNIDFLYISKYSISLLSIILCYILCSNKFLVISNRLILLSIIIYFLVALIQFKIPDFLTFLVSRSATQTTLDLLSSGRGMLSLTGEPSHFGKTITVLNILYVFNVINEEKTKVNRLYLLIMSMVLFAMNCALSQSFYACFFHFVVLNGIIFILNPRLSLVFLATMALSLASVIGFFHIYFPGYRIFIVAHNLFNSPELLFTQGAFVRVLNVPLTFINLSYFGFLGAGNSSFILSKSADLTIETLNFTVSNRLFGGFAEYALKMGILSIPLLAVYTYMMANIARLNFTALGFHRSVGMVFMAMLLLLSLQDGSLANPLMIFAIVHVFLKVKASFGGGSPRIFVNVVN